MFGREAVFGAINPFRPDTKKRPSLSLSLLASKNRLEILVLALNGPQRNGEKGWDGGSKGLRSDFSLLSSFAAFGTVEMV